MFLRLKVSADAAVVVLDVRDLANGWVDERTLGRSVHIFRTQILCYTACSIVCVHERFILSDGALGLGQSIFVCRFLPCLQHCVFIISYNAIRFTPPIPLLPKPANQFCCFQLPVHQFHKIL